MNTHQVPRFAQVAVKSCGSLKQRLDLATCLALVPLNAELVACRTSREREAEIGGQVADEG
jgi:hypothetical protein